MFIPSFQVWLHAYLFRNSKQLISFEVVVTSAVSALDGGISEGLMQVLFPLLVRSQHFSIRGKSKPRFVPSLYVLCCTASIKEYLKRYSTPLSLALGLELPWHFIHSLESMFGHCRILPWSGHSHHEEICHRLLCHMCGQKRYKTVSYPEHTIHLE